MLLQDYVSIIIHGICAPPNFLISHFRREIKKLNERDYEAEEIKYNFDEVITLIRTQIEKIYNKNLATYNQYSEKDKTLPKDKKHYYPKPDINKIPITIIKYPSGFKQDLSGLTKGIYLDDVAKVEKAINEIMGNVKDEDKLNFVEKNLFKLKEKAFNTDADYSKAIRAINDFFRLKKVTIKTPIFVKSGNIKSLAFAMGEIWKSQCNEVITYEYLQFYKKLFSIFNNQKFEKNKLFSCNLYKYSISKT